MAAHAQVNGHASSPSSAVIDHLLKYPVINDSVTTFKQNQYGQKSIQLSDSAYKTFAQPVVPYLSRPFSYVSPYIKKVDTLLDQTLSRVDQRFPIVKKPTGELYQAGRDVMLFPLRKGAEGRDHLATMYATEYKKAGGDGFVTSGKALVSTAFIVSTQTLAWVGGFLKTKKDQGAAMVQGTNQQPANN